MKKVIVLSLICLTAGQLFGQSNIGFFHLNDATPQNMNYNALAFPKAKTFVSLPALSGINLSINNSFGLMDILTETGDSTLIDIDRFLSNQKENSYLNTSLIMTDFMFGYRLDAKSYFTIFVNDRVDATAFYPVKLMNFLWQGNGAYVGRNYVVDDLTYDFTHYREWGVGYGRTFDILGFDTHFAARLKYLTGLFHSSIKDNLSLSIHTDAEDYALTFALDEGIARSAGLSMISGDEDFDVGYLVFNKNGGFGLDLAGQIALNKKLTVGLAINDLGFISWKENTEVTTFDDVSFTFEGVDLDNIDGFVDALKDSLEALNVDTTATRFTTSLNSRIYLTGSYEVTDGGFVQASIANYVTQGKLKSAFGIGYLHNLGNWLAASVTTSVGSQRGVDMGAGFMIRGGGFQLYLAVDNIFSSINIPEASGINIKTGINFVFGKPSTKKKSKTVAPINYDDFPDVEEKTNEDTQDQDQ